MSNSRICLNGFKSMVNYTVNLFLFSFFSFLKEFTQTQILQIFYWYPVNNAISRQESEAATRVAPCKKVFLEISQNSQENTCARVSFLNFIKKEALAQVFSCEFCEISKNTFFTEYIWTTASKEFKTRVLSSHL